MTNKISLDSSDNMKFVDGIQTTARSLDEIVKGSHSAHKTRHQNAGADEINVAGLSGELADNQPPKAHKTSHQNAGADEISVVGLSGLLADGQTPLVHKTSHESGGADAIKLDDLSVPDDNTDLNASTTKHGLLPKMDTVITNLDADKVDGKDASDLVQMTGAQTVAGVKTFTDTPKINAIAERTADTGVTVDGVLIKDSLDVSNIVDKSSVQTISGKKTFSDDIVFSGDKTIQTNVKARAYLGTAQYDLVDGDWTKVLLDTENYDIGADFDTANNKFVVPVTGYYLIIGQVALTNIVADKDYRTAIYKDASSIATANIHASVALSLYCLVSTIAYLSANDEITLYVLSNAGVDTVDVGGAASYATYLAIHLLSV